MKPMIGAIATVAMLIGSTTVLAAGQAEKGRPDSTTGSAFIDVLDFDANWTQNMANSAVFPDACTTEPHLAGPNEVAVITMSGFMAPSGTVYHFLYLKVAVSEDGWPFEILSPGFATIDGMSDGAAQVSVSRKMALEEGVTYQFSPSFQTDAPVTVGFATCQGTVMFFRKAS